MDSNTTGSDLQKIAIIGMSCRFPRSPDVKAFWRNVAKGVDCITDLTDEDLARAGVEAALRRDPRYIKTASIVEGVDMFDAGFFGMTPSEVRLTDPQQRLLLECAHDAFEDAGYVPGIYEGQVGVFAGVGISRYLLHHLKDTFLTAKSSQYIRMLLGNDKDYAATLISHKLDLTGPSINVATACSTSLVAVTLACKSLLLFDCDMALAGAVNILVPHGVGYLHEEGGLFSADGRIRAFDAQGSGPVAGSGVGAVLLKRLEDAIRDGDHIHAVICGAALNNDGADKMSFTAPSEVGQSQVIADALAMAEVEPDEITYIEAHGTGTPIGDPIEIAALSRVFRARTQRKSFCAIGSVKTNLGHLDTAAGMAGLIKTVEALKHRQLPPSLHFERPNPQIDFESSPFFVNTRLQSWETDRLPRRAGVSSFGFGGTNAHVVLEEAPALPQRLAEPARPAELLVLSARDEHALTTLCERYVDVLREEDGAELRDLCFTASTGRAHHAVRLSAVASNREELAGTLESFLHAGAPKGVRTGRVASQEAPIVFLFTGQGAQYPAMGKELYEHEHAFREALDACAAQLTPHMDRPLLSLLWGPDADLLGQTRYTQPALFALEYALAQLWSSWRVRPQCVLGHSIGEYGAACLAGVLDLGDAARLIAARGRLMHELTTPGSLQAVSTGASRLLPLLEPYRQQVALAADNGPEQVVISGEVGAVGELVAKLTADGIECRPLNASHAFHSPLMRPMLAAFERIVRQVRFREPQIEFISSVTGRPVSRELCDPGYWVRQVEATVQFGLALEQTRQRWPAAYVEIGPGATLVGLGQQCLPESEAAWISSLRRSQPEYRHLMASLGELYTRGVSLDWSAFYSGRECRRACLPTYAFQRKRYWLEEPESSRTTRASSAQARSLEHPLLSAQRWVAGLEGKLLFDSLLDLQQLNYLADHQLFGAAFMPASGFLEMALAAGKRASGSEALRLCDVEILHGLRLPERGGCLVQLQLDPTDAASGAREFAIYATISDGDAAPRWVKHVTGRLAPATTARSGLVEALEALKRRIAEPVDPRGIYEDYRARGIDFGPCFQAVAQAWRSGPEALGRIRLPAPLLGTAGSYQVHPVLLDACFQILWATGLLEGGNTFVATALGALEFLTSPDQELWSHVRLLPAGSSGHLVRTADVTLFSPEGRVLVRIEGVQLRSVTREALLAAAGTAVNDCYYELAWRPWARVGVGEPALLPAPQALARELQELPQALGRAFALGAYREALAQVDALSLRHVAEALRACGLPLERGSTFSLSPFLAASSIVRRHDRLVGHLLRMLEQAGVLSRKGETWRVEARPADVLPAPGDATHLPDSPAGAEYALATRCGPALGEVLTGRMDPLQLLFPEGDLSLARRVYQDTPIARLMNTLLQEVLSRALAALPANRRIRILEIGAGTGATTSYLLPRLPADRTSYTFTDVSAHFIARARETFKDHPWVQYKILNIDEPFEAQGFSDASYDVIVASNVLHAARELRPMLERVKRLLVPGGMLLLREVLRPQCWGDISFGLTEGWWHFDDHTLRPDYPLLSAQQWQGLLSSCGFSESAVMMPGADNPEAIILAQHATANTNKQQGRRWLLFADRGGVGQALASRLRQRGADVTVVSAGSAYAHLGSDQFEVEPGRLEDYERLLRAAGAGVERVVHLWSLDAAEAGELDVPRLTAAARTGAGSVLCLAESLLRVGGRTPPRLWLVTRGAQAVDLSEATPGLAQAPTWGVGKTLALEHPELWGGIIDLGPTSDASEVDMLLAEAAYPDGEDMISLRSGARYIARLERSAPAPAEKGRSYTFHADASYLLTGGLGTLALKTAAWMVEQGARHLVLVGRHGPKPEARKAIASLDQAGARLLILEADVASSEQMKGVLTQVQSAMPALRGVIHTAGVAGGAQQGADVDALQEVLHPKVSGAWVLHELTRSMDLDFFVCFSSMVSVWGSTSQAHYVAANHFLDQLAHHRRTLGLPALTINWGPWAGTLADAQMARANQSGVSPLLPEEGMAALGELLRTPGGQLIVARIDWSLFRQLYESRGRRALFERLHAPATKATEQQQQPAEGLSLLRELESLPPEARRSRLMAWLQSVLSRIMGWEPSHLPDVHQGFFSMGLDSLLTLELRGHLARDLGVKLSARELFDYPTVAELSVRLLQQIPSLAEPATPEVEDAPAPEAAPDEDLSEAQIAELLAREVSAWKDTTEP